MKTPSPAQKASVRDAFVIVASTVLVVSGLFAFEQVTGLPASVRGSQVYNALPMPADGTPYNKKEESRIPKTSDLTKERVCDRISRGFGWDSDMWERVSTRVFQRLGFKCKQ